MAFGHMQVRWCERGKLGGGCEHAREYLVETVSRSTLSGNWQRSDGVEAMCRSDAVEAMGESISWRL